MHVGRRRRPVLGPGKFSLLLNEWGGRLEKISFVVEKKEEKESGREEPGKPPARREFRQVTDMAKIAKLFWKSKGTRGERK